MGRTNPKPLDPLTLHVGKTEGVEERLARHVGGMLRPPFSPDRWAELPRWRPTLIGVEGSSWDYSTVDIAIAGGWGGGAGGGE